MTTCLLVQTTLNDVKKATCCVFNPFQHATWRTDANLKAIDEDSLPSDKTDKFESEQKLHLQTPNT